LWTPRRDPDARFAGAGHAAADTPWRDASWCALDLELTGLNPRQDHIIAVGMVPIERGRVLLGQSVYTLVKSSRRSQPAAVLAHRLRVADLAQAPALDEVMDLVITTLTGRVPVFHFAPVEQAFLLPQLRRRRLRLGHAADTETLGRLWLERRDRTPQPGGLSLGRLSRHLGQRAEVAHHALGDAVSTAQAFIALATHLDNEAPQTVGSLLSESQRPPAWRPGR